MKKALIICAALIVIACGAYFIFQPSAPDDMAEQPSASNAVEQDEAVEAPAESVVSVTPEPSVPKTEPSAEPEGEPSAEPEVEQSPVVEDTQPTNTEPEAEPSPIPEDTQMEETVDVGDAEQPTVAPTEPATDKEAPSYIPEESTDIPKGWETSEDVTAPSEDTMNGGNGSGGTDFPSAEGPATPPAPPATLTDEEVQKVVNDYLDNFKTTVDMSDWDQEAIEKLDENIEIIKNNTPSDIVRVMKDYQEGNTPKEMVEFYIWDFLERGGYGSQEITVQ